MLTAREAAELLGCGAAFAAAADPSGTAEPNCMSLPPFGFPATGPPFGKYPEAPAALMVTEGLRL